MKKSKEHENRRTCGQCYHQIPCFYAAGGCGNNDNTDATNCVNFETLTGILEKYASIFGYLKL